MGNYTLAMRKSFVVFVFIFFSLLKLSAQTTVGQESWFDYLNQNRFSKKWASWTDLQLRTRDNYVNAKNAYEVSLGASYYVTDNLKATGALSYVNNYPNASHDFNLGEWRPWQQLQLTSDLPKSQWLQWIRLEERFNQQVSNNKPTDVYLFNYRIRYNVIAQFPLTAHKYQKGSISFVSSNELYLNFGKPIVYNTFDQNRFFLGFYYFLNKSNICQIGYTKMYQKYNAPNKYYNADVLRLSVFNTIDFRK